MTITKPAESVEAALPEAPVRIAAVQTVSGPDVDANLKAVDALIAEAAAEGACLVALPEYFPLISSDEMAKVRIREAEGEGPLQSFLADAARRLAGRRPRPALDDQRR